MARSLLYYSTLSCARYVTARFPCRPHTPTHIAVPVPPVPFSRALSCDVNTVSHPLSLSNLNLISLSLALTLIAFTPFGFRPRRSPRMAGPVRPRRGHEGLRHPRRIRQRRPHRHRQTAQLHLGRTALHHAPVRARETHTDALGPRPLLSAFCFGFGLGASSGSFSFVRSLLSSLLFCDFARITNTTPSRRHEDLGSIRDRDGGRGRSDPLFIFFFLWLRKGSNGARSTKRRTHPPPLFSRQTAVPFPPCFHL